MSKSKIMADLSNELGRIERAQKLEELRVKLDESTPAIMIEVDPEIAAELLSKGTYNSDDLRRKLRDDSQRRRAVQLLLE